MSDPSPTPAKVQVHIYVNRNGWGAGVMPSVVEASPVTEEERRAAWMQDNGLDGSDEEEIDVLELDDDDSDADELIVHIPRPKD